VRSFFYDYFWNFILDVVNLENIQLKNFFLKFIAMTIGIPKEIKNNENRVAVTPAGVAEFVRGGHRVFVQHTAGIGSGFTDAEYTKAGAEILPDIESVYASSDMIIKVKEPIAREYPLVRKGQLLFTYFHFASDRELTEAMLASGATCIAYETVADAKGALPLLIPMSEVAGRMSVQEGARFLEKPQGGKGLLIGGVPGVKPAKVLILGAGVVGRNAALMAAGLGADVTITDISLPTLRHISEVMPKNVKTLYSSRHNIEQELKDVDLVIGSVLIPGAKAPHLVTKDMLKLMQPGTVMVDVAIDQGGCFETSHPTTHTDPVYVVEGIVHYAVANIPGAVPRTSTLALTNATLPYAIKLANQGWREACKHDSSLAAGVNIVDGKITYEAVAQAWNMKYSKLKL
jgi:alanine dehydrogenase